MSGIRLRLLGAPVVEQAGKPLALPTRKLLGLLAYLALEGPSPRSKLAGLFWSEQDESAARGHLRRELNRLRHTPLGQALHTEGDLLGLEPLETDVTAFKAAVKREDFPAALELYRGPLLEGLELAGAVGFEAWLEQEREELSQTRRSALQRQAEHLEATHDLRGALAARLTLLREDELQELHHREAMRLHALLGEREAALERFERLRALLRRELHLDPLPETQALAQQIAQGTLRPPPPPSPTPTPTGFALHPPLIGREAEWARLEAAWEARQGIYLAGPSGVGKTRLLLEFARHQGPLFLLQAQPSDSGIPYAFYSRAIRQSLVQFPGLELAPWVRRELARLVPELEEETPPPITTPEGKLRLLEAITEVIRALGRQGVRSIVTDDLQFVRDAASLEVATYAMTRLLPEGVLRPLVAFRPEELDPLILKTIREQVEQGQAVLLELRPFSETELLRLVRALSGASGAVRFTQRLYGATGGNPLFVLETLKALYESGALQVGPEGWHTPYDQETTDYRELPLPASVREAVWRRVEGLGAAPRRLLEAASLAGDGFSLEALRGATALSEWESVEALEQALAADLLHRQDTGYAFSHDLVRRSVREGLSPERRRLLHRTLAQSLARQGGNPARVAEHWEEGGKPQEAIPWRIRAAEAAVQVYAHQEALQQYNLALLDGAEGKVAFAIERERARLWQTLDERTPWAEALGAMEGLARTLGDAALLAETRLGWAEHHLLCGRYREALAEAEGVLQSGPMDAPLQAKALYLGGRALGAMGDLMAAEAHLLQAQAHLPAAPLTLEVYDWLSIFAYRQGNLEAALRYTEAERALAQKLGSRTGQNNALQNAATFTAAQGRYQEAVQLAERAIAEAREMGDVTLLRYALLNLFSIHYQRSNFEAALGPLEEGLQMAREPQNPEMEAKFLNNLSLVHWYRGALGEAYRAVSRALELSQQSGHRADALFYQVVLADDLHWLGQPAEARLLLEAAVQSIQEMGLWGRLPWAETHLARCEVSLGQPEQALKRLERLRREPHLADALNPPRMAWVEGLAWLRLDQPTRALQAVQDTHSDDPTTASQLWSVRFWALARLGQVSPEYRHRPNRGIAVGYADTSQGPGGPSLEDLQAGLKLLQAQEIPPLEKLSLRQAVMAALRAQGDLRQAQEQQGLYEQALQALSESLEGYPKLKEAFERGFGVHQSPLS
ncbi:BTAD domain-containing putative transcriptional regulator [Meiothermus sp.]|uniref:ATP-binding protein n=1 Tax=Meiothermus sp. TaxID=1955249 RepID=UPI0021DC1AA1|nr:AAA family ATPase [Meiothermus sp.]GIW25816.1 MAG: transcriptional activator [Meiothermus sp.]